MKTRRSASDWTLDSTIYCTLVILGFITIYPFWNALVISFNSGLDTANGGITFWPRAFTFENYRLIFIDNRLMQAFLVTVLRTLAGTSLSIAVISLFAFGISRRGLIGRKWYMIFAIITIYFQGGLIPSFLLIHDLHLMNTFWVMVIPTIVNVWNMIIFRTFFAGLPEALEESAKIDGANSWTLFFSIIIPVSLPVFATLSLFTAVTHWNSWFDASIYITKSNLLPLQTVLINIINSAVPNEQLQTMGGAAYNFVNPGAATQKSIGMATMMVATIPIMMIYPFLQKYFVKGVLIGSLKE